MTQPAVARTDKAKSTAGRIQGALAYESRYPPRRTEPRKRMMAQGRKSYFLYDARAFLERTGMPAEKHRAFLETLFAKGSRTSTQDAIDFIGTKVDEKVLTAAEGNGLADLVDRYSFWR